MPTDRASAGTDAVSGFAKTASDFSTEVVNRFGKLAKITTHDARKDVITTMIYTLVLNRDGRGVCNPTRWIGYNTIRLDASNNGRRSPSPQA